MACSDVLVAGNGYAVVARSLDFPGGGPAPGGGGVQMGYVPVNAVNTSNINLPQTGPVHPVTWTNVHAAIGQTRYTDAIHDGINSAGLYVARQNLPAAYTKYPFPDPSDRRPELGAMDIPSYVLGTSATVEEALENLKIVQIVINAPMTTLFGQNRPLAYPYHLIVRDKNGGSLVVEWLDRKTYTYYHQAGSSETVEMINFSGKKVFKDFQMSGITNEPPLSWHLNNFNQYQGLFQGTSSTLVDGQLLMGSGYLGMPGDYTSPSRFIRLNTLAKFVPAPKSSIEAETSARSTLTTVVTPVSGSPEFTLWISVSNLTDGIYQWSPVLNAVNTDPNALRASAWDINAPRAIRFELRQIMKSNTLPKGFVDSTIKATPPLSAEDGKTAIKLSENSGTPEIGKVDIEFTGATTQFDTETFDTSAGSGITYMK
jgi:choloylglycine hydrolase